MCGAAVRCVGRPCGVQEHGAKSRLAPRGHEVEVEGASRDGAGGGKAMGNTKKRGRSKHKRAYSTTDSLVVPHQSTEVA